MRTLPAAAIQKGDTVRLEDGTEVAVKKVHNSDPVGGQIRWETTESGDIQIGASVRVEVVKL